MTSIVRRLERAHVVRPVTPLLRSQQGKQALEWLAQIADEPDRYAFYDRAEKAFAVVMTGELVKYGNIILKKGVTPVG